MKHTSYFQQRRIQLRSPRHQQGVALIISLLVLLIMTVIGVSAMQTTTLEERMAGNLRNSNLSFQAAESALRAGEDMLSETSLPGDPSLDGSTGYWDDHNNLDDPATPQPWWLDKDANWWKTTGVVGGVYEFDTATLSGISDNPRFVLELVSEQPDDLGVESYEASPPPTTYSRVTARAEAGPNGESVTYLQSIFARPYQ
jgi:type IV pilus assembly protein PilX